MSLRAKAVTRLLDLKHRDDPGRSPETICRVLHGGPGFRLGYFVCPPSDWRWTDVNWIGTAVHVAFPMRSVVIRQPHGEVLTDPNIAMYYDADQTFTRELADPRGDRCTFVEIDESLMQEIRPDGAIEGPLPVDARTYSAQWTTLLSLVSGHPIERVAIDELFLAILSRLFAAQEVGTDGAQSQKDLVADTRALLARNFMQPLTLAEIAAAVYSSPYHLSRTFRRVTGTTLAAYVSQLRLRASLERVWDGGMPLVDVACELGFSSHSHFTARFRESFGFAPSALRSRSVRIDELSAGFCGA